MAKENSKKVLVTGGSGFVGSRLKITKPNWTFLSSKDCDLTKYKQVKSTFSKIKPDAILHLANKVGGIKENSTKQAEFYDTNTYINTNVLKDISNTQKFIISQETKFLSMIFH